MYSPTAYVMAATLASACVNIFYPIMVSIFTFWFYKYPIHDFGGFMAFLSV